jgi:predicted RecB family nuclease
VTHPRIPMLSKSRFLAGLQCHLRLWHQCYNPTLAAEVSPVQQALFDTGHEVGRLATELYPGGARIEEDHLHHEEAVKSTAAAMQDPNVSALYEAAFVQDGVRVPVDILERAGRGTWNLIEVKSSTSVKDVHLPDVAVQHHVLKKSGLGVDRVGILHLDGGYVYDGRYLELEKLFRFSDLTEEVKSMEAGISGKIQELQGVLAGGAPPEVQPSRHCESPYLCELWEHCTAGTPEHWIMHLSGITQRKLDELIALGIKDIRDIPGAFRLTELQGRIRSCVVKGREYLAPQLEDELKRVDYPIHFLDFETFMPAIPRYAGTRPYQTIPFQWSDHTVYPDGTVNHSEYLCGEDKDPREEFARTLLETSGEKGTIFVYTTYEVGIIRTLAEDLPSHRQRLLALPDRLSDLHAAIRRYFYHPEFRGSFSLKEVLPALLPEMGYENLAIQEGNMASLAYLRMLDPSTPEKEKEKIRGDLLAYCAHDTLAMVRIRQVLLRRSGLKT